MARIPQNPFSNYSSSRANPLDYASGEQAQAIGRFFNAVYAWMCAGLALTAVVAWWVASRPDIVNGVSHLFLVLGIVEVVLVWKISSAVNRISAGVAMVLFLAFAALNGLTLAGLLMFYTHALLASAFAITAGTFGAMSLYGFFTRRDLTAMGSFLFMALIGLVIASFVSLVWHPTLLTVAINYVGVLIFVGLTAYHTQSLKIWAEQTAGNGAMASRLVVIGALQLYLDFLNLFVLILELLASNSDER